MEKLINKFESVDNIIDLIGDDDKSKMFDFLIDKFGYLLSNDEKEVLSKKGHERRVVFNKILKKLGPLFLSSKQVIEDRKKLDNKKHSELLLSDEPVIWAPNHSFKDDALSTILAIDRNAYFLFGSLPQFYNTIDGITAWANGSIIINRKNKSSRMAAVKKCSYALDLGIDLIYYPEGVWNKSPNLLALNLWPGIYKLAKEKNVKVVPVIHYKKEPHLKEKNDYIHTVVDDAIDVSNLEEVEFLKKLRDTYAYWTYIMMEKYGKSTRKEVLGDYNSSLEYWEDMLELRRLSTERYDLSIETTANYEDKHKCELFKAWEDIANIKNINEDNIYLVNDAKKKIKTLKENDFQRRF